MREKLLPTTSLESLVKSTQHHYLLAQAAMQDENYQELVRTTSGGFWTEFLISWMKNYMSKNKEKVEPTTMSQAEMINYISEACYNEMLKDYQVNDDYRS